MREVRISDATMKQAAASNALALTFKEKLELAKLLDKLGVSVIEVEGIEKLKADSLRIKSLASLVQNSILAVPVKLDEADVDNVWAALKGAKAPRLQVEAAISPANMEYIEGMKADGMLKAIVATIEKCAALCPDVELVAVDATRADEAFLQSVMAAAIEAGATTITVADTAGKMLPEEFDEFVRAQLAAVPQLADVTLGISCSNKLFMSNACAIHGVVAGAGEVKASSYPMDTVRLDRIAKIISERGDAFDASCSVRVTEMKRAMAQVNRICDSNTKSSLFSEGFKGSDDGIVLTASDDKDAVIACAAQLGYDLSEEDAALVYETFQQIAASKDKIGSLELDAIVASAAMQVPPTFILENYVINSGNTIKATANVRLRKGDQLIQEVCIGDGPIDAAFMAIEKAAGVHYELEDFQLKSVTEGQEAMGEAVIKLNCGGKMYSGRGISTDIVGSTIRAYVNALNKIVYEEQN